MQICRRNRIPATLENPKMSRIWLLPSFVGLIQAARSNNHIINRPTFISFNMCMFGVPWQKPTSILGVNVDVSPLELTCLGTSGMCSRTGLRHQVLEGRSPSGQFWTKIAAAYPLRFARALASCLVDATRQQLASRFAKALNCG